MGNTPRLEISAAEYRKIANGSMTEAEWRRNVKELAAHYGWELLLEIPDRAYQVIAEAAATDRSLVPTMHALRAWPDLFYGSRQHQEAMWLELKRQKVKVPEHQRLKHDQLHDSGITGGVWRPEHRDVLEVLFRDGTGADRE